MIEKQLKSLISQSEKNLNAIAKEAGVDYGTLHRFVHDGRKVQITFVESLCKYFGLQLGSTDRQVKSLLRDLAKDALRSSGKAFKHRNGRLNSEKLSEHLLAGGDLDADTKDPVTNLAARRFNELGDHKRAELINSVAFSMNLSDALFQANQKWLHKIDQALVEFRDAFNSMNESRKKKLREFLVHAVEAQDLEKKLSGQYQISLKISVGHIYQDEDGEVVDENWESLQPNLMAAAVRAWDSGEEFTPESFRQFF
ncbi:MAG: hypothetical protein AAGG48_29670 [Planctomycetota bacterium]